MVFKDLYSLTDFNNANVITEKKDGSDMANGSSRCDRDHSNISPPSHILQNTDCMEKIKKKKLTTQTEGKMAATGKKGRKEAEFS